MAMNNDDQLNELQAVLENYPVADRSGQPAAAQAPAAAPEEAPGVPSNADRLADAQVAGNKQQLMSDLLRSFQGAIQASAPNSGFKADTSIADGISARSGQALANVQGQIKQEAADKVAKQEADKHAIFMKEAQNKLALSNITVEDTKEAHDPNSKISQSSREIFKEYLKMQNKPYNEAAVNALSGDDIMKMMPDMQKIGFEYFKNAQQNKELDAKTRDQDLSRERQQTRDTKEDQFKNRQLEIQDAQRRDIADQNNATRLAMAQEKADAKAKEREEKGSEGQKAVDKDYAKHFNEFTSTGAKKAEQSIAKMEKLADELDKDQGPLESGGGRIANALPDVVRSRDAIRRRDLARSLGNDTLKATFGGQLSDGEREAKAKEYYNDALSNKENAAILRQKIADSKAQVEAERTKAMYYKDNNSSLKGFGGEALEGPKTGPYGDTTERNGKKYKWNAQVGKYQLDGDSNG